MNHRNDNALTSLRTGVASRIAASIERALATWRSLTRRHFWWTLCVGIGGGLLYLASHSPRMIRDMLLRRSPPGDLLWASAVSIGVSIVVAFFFLLAVSIAEDGDYGQTRAWTRYVVATLVAAGASTAFVHVLSPDVPVAGLVGWYPLESQLSIDTFVFSNWLLFGGLAVFVYARLKRVWRSQAAFKRAELERATVSRQVLRSQLAAMQAQVEPRFLFNALDHIEALYERDARSADRMLDDLIAFLRAVLPQLRGEDSTLAGETELAEAYLRIVQARMGSRLEFAFDIPMPLRAARFPPMLLLPLVENAVRHGLEPLPLGGRIKVGATVHANRVRLAVSDNGLGDATELQEGHGLTTLRERLALLYGRRATLSLSATHPRGLTATIEVPAHEHTSDHR